MMPVQCGQECQRNTEKKNRHCCLGQTVEGQIAVGDARYSDEARGDDNEHNNNASPATCRDCVMTGQMPVHDAGGNMGVTRATTPVQWGQRRPRNKGNNAGAMPEKLTARCWWWRQRVLQLLCDWADASLWCWRQQEGDESNNASVTRAKAATQQRRWRQCNAGNNNSAMLTMTPAQCGQGCQYNASKNANAALAGPSKAKSPWNNARYGNEATGKDDDHDNDATHMDVSGLRCGWADASLRCWGQFQCNEGKEASGTWTTMPAQRWQQQQGNAW
jgi:hypothetical protein